MSATPASVSPTAEQEILSEPNNKADETSATPAETTRETAQNKDTHSVEDGASRVREDLCSETIPRPAETHSSVLPTLSNKDDLAHAVSIFPVPVPHSAPSVDLSKYLDITSSRKRKFTTESDTLQQQQTVADEHSVRPVSPPTNAVAAITSEGSSSKGDTSAASDLTSFIRFLENKPARVKVSPEEIKAVKKEERAAIPPPPPLQSEPIQAMQRPQVLPVNPTVPTVSHQSKSLRAPPPLRPLTQFQMPLPAPADDMVDAYLNLHKQKSNGVGRPHYGLVGRKQPTVVFGDTASAALHTAVQARTPERKQQQQQQQQPSTPPSSATVMHKRKAGADIVSSQDEGSTSKVSKVSPTSTVHTVSPTRQELDESPTIDTTATSGGSIGVLVAEECLETFPTMIRLLQQKSVRVNTDSGDCTVGIECYDCSLQAPTSVIVNEVTCICFLLLESLLNLNGESDSETRAAAALKQMIKSLTTIAFKFKTIWLLLVPSMDCVQYPAEYVIHLNSLMVRVSQAVSRFPVQVIVRECCFTTQDGHAKYPEQSMSEAVHHIVSITSQDKEPKLFRRPFLKLLHCCDGVLQANFTAHCEYLQWFPSINYYTASMVLSVLPLQQLVKAVTKRKHFISQLVDCLINEKLSCEKEFLREVLMITQVVSISCGLQK